MSAEPPATSKSLGQHLLMDPGYCQRIVRFSQVAAGDPVVEIGPGTGQLTRLLLDAAAAVIAIEFDRRMAEHLNRTLAREHPGRLTVIQANVLDFDWAPVLGASPPKIIGNLPYNISTRILREMIPLADRIQTCTFLLQKEVTARIVARTGSRDYGFFTLLMQYHFRPEAGFTVPPGAFSPRPKVVSQIVRLTPLPPRSPDPDYPRLVRLMKAAFGQRRKTLWNNLKGLYEPARLEQALTACRIPARSRPQEITLAQYVQLLEML